MVEWLQLSPAGDLIGLSAISLFAVLFLTTFVSEDAACITAGALAASGEMSLVLAIASCFLGIVAGDLGLYWTGRLLGPKLLGFRLAQRVVSEKSLSTASEWLDKRGASAVFLSRFVTGLRLPTYLAAGFLRTNFRNFALYFILAAGIWTPLLVGSVALSAELFGSGILIVSVVIFILVRLGLSLASRRRRRIMIGKLRRIRRWEFWPLGVFYFPVVCYVAYLGVRYRGLTVFTCANPGIPAGGFVGESKDEIYSLLAASGANAEWLLRHGVVRAGLTQDEKLMVARRIMVANELSFPVVVKPDVGERGKDVRIVASYPELEAALENAGSTQIIQEFFDGKEVSIFYVRRPGSDRGEIFSATEKIFPSVVGDGISTLENLILEDDRAVCLAKKYFAENAGRLDDVPSRGEPIHLIRIGTHSRGAIFRDGSHLLTPEIEAAIDSISQHVGGFNFGRFDIRYSSVEEFRRGRGFKIIELNGVTSESTNIYDPHYSLIDAYRILFRQWRIAFEIGVENQALGCRPASISELGRLVFSAKMGRRIAEQGRSRPCVSSTSHTKSIRVIR